MAIPRPSAACQATTKNRVNMAHVTKLSDYELKRGDPVLNLDDDVDEGRHVKRIVPEVKDAPAVSTTAVVKDADES